MISDNARTIRCWCSHATLIILLPFTPSVSLCASYSSIMPLHSSPYPMLLSPVLAVGWGCLRTDWICSCPRWCHSSLPPANWKRRIALHCMWIRWVLKKEQVRDLSIMMAYCVCERSGVPYGQAPAAHWDQNCVGKVIGKERTISVSLKHHWVCVL